MNKKMDKESIIKNLPNKKDTTKEEEIKEVKYKTVPAEEGETTGVAKIGGKRFSFRLKEVE